MYAYRDSNVNNQSRTSGTSNPLILRKRWMSISAFSEKPSSQELILSKFFKL